MADRLEDRIRDYLAEHLELLGDGLCLVQKEYVLTNSLGTGGKIDILARDKFGIHVVIEIKRSDQAARQTLTEIHKYVALLRIQQGLDETQVRVMVVSTDWHELRLPLSECVEVFPYTVDPFAITVLPDGTITHTERITLIRKTGIIRLSRMQAAYCFRERKTRDATLSKLVLAATNATLVDFVILKLDYAGKNPSICFPFVLYFIFSSPLLNTSPEESERLKARLEWDDSLDQPDENFLVAINSSECMWDDFEIGYPEKLTTILTDWKIVEISKHGRLASSHSLLSDEDILCLAQSVEGGSPLYIYKLCSPKLSAAWKQLLTDLNITLQGMPEWGKVVPLFLLEIESECPNASVSICVFNPGNLFMSLYPVAWHADFSRCPYLQILVVDETKEVVRHLVSSLAWNGQTINLTPKQIVKRVYRSTINWQLAHNMHETHTREPKMMVLHNLVAPLVEFTFVRNSDPLVRQLLKEKSGLLRESFDFDTVNGLDDFSSLNRTYLDALKDFLESEIAGLPGSFK